MSNNPSVNWPLSSNTKLPKVRRIRKLREGSWFFKFTVSVLRKVIALKVRRFSEGEELIPERGAAIVIAPHLSEFDALLAPELVTRAGRMPRIFAKASLWKIPVVKQAFNSGKLIPVYRGTENAAKSLKIANDALKDGETVFIFPEGTCSKDPDSWPMTCKTGVARLALMSGAPVIPVLQDGAQFLKQKNRTDLPWFQRYHFGKKPLVHLKAYPAIDFSAAFDASVSDPTPDKIEEVNRIIENTLTRLVEESRGVKAPARWSPKLKARLEEAEND